MESVTTTPICVTPTGLVSRKNAAIALAKKPKTLCEWAAKGLGPKPIQVGGRIFYRWADIQAFAGGGE